MDIFQFTSFTVGLIEIPSKMTPFLEFYSVYYGLLSLSSLPVGHK